MTSAQRIDPDRIARSEAALNQQAARAAATGEHVWIAAAAFRVSEDMARRLSADEASAVPMLDAETLLSVSIGCYACEEPLTRRLLTRRCRPVA